MSLVGETRLELPARVEVPALPILRPTAALATPGDAELDVIAELLASAVAPESYRSADYRSWNLHQILHQTSSPGGASGTTDTRLFARNCAFPRSLSSQMPLGATTGGHSKSAARKGLRVQVSSPAHWLGNWEKTLPAGSGSVVVSAAIAGE